MAASNDCDSEVKFGSPTGMVFACGGVCHVDKVDELQLEARMHIVASALIHL